MIFSDFKSIINSIYMYLFVVILILILILLLTTTKYKDKYKNIYSMFMDLSFKDIVLYSTIILNFIYIIYFVVHPELFNDYGLYLIILNTIISIIFRHKLLSSIVDILLVVLTYVMFDIMNLVDQYMQTIYISKEIKAARILFSIFFVLFILYVTIRKFENIFKTKRKKVNKNTK